MKRSILVCCSLLALPTLACELVTDGDGGSDAVHSGGGSGTTGARPMASCLEEPAGLTEDAYITGTIEGRVCRAPMTHPFVGGFAIDSKATTEETGIGGPRAEWGIFVPNAVGVYSCGEWASPQQIRHFSFSVYEDGPAGRWMGGSTGQDGPCVIEVLRAASAPGEVFEGTFSGTVHNLAGWKYDVTDGYFIGTR